MEINESIIFVACIIFLLVIGKMFMFPLIKVLKIIFNSILGAILIYIINLMGSAFGFHIGLNIVTSIIVGILGIPGAILLTII